MFESLSKLIVQGSSGREGGAGPIPDRKPCLKVSLSLPVVNASTADDLFSFRSQGQGYVLKNTDPPSSSQLKKVCIWRFYGFIYSLVTSSLLIAHCYTDIPMQQRLRNHNAESPMGFDVQHHFTMQQANPTADTASEQSHSRKAASYSRRNAVRERLYLDMQSTPQLVVLWYYQRRSAGWRAIQRRNFHRYVQEHTGYFSYFHRRIVYLFMFI